MSARSQLKAIFGLFKRTHTKIHFPLIYIDICFKFQTIQTNQLYPNSRDKSLREAHGDYNDETYEDMNSASEEWSSSEEVTRGLFDQIVITRKPTHLQNLEAKLESDLNNL